MVDLPLTGDTPLIRTDFSDDSAWEGLVDASRQPSADGCLANLQIVEGKQFEGVLPEMLGKASSDSEHAVLFIADTTTMTHQDRPILCVNVFDPQQTFRVVPSELWGVENNLTLANMDFDEFSYAAGSEGIFRGF